MTLPSYVGRYEVRKEIATGGFAVVVQAWDAELHSLVAIKILHENLAAQKDVQLRFLEEARLLRRIRSPNVVTVHDVGRLNDGRPYFIMDFADRGTLAPRLERKPGARMPDPHDIMLLVDAVADGLSAIHEAGIVHRDLKPANILFQKARRGPAEPFAPAGKDPASPSKLVNVDERILVGDLGIAKDMVKHGGHITLMGGTPLYAAPEQNEGGEITPAADVYAATALLWHVLTGEVPNRTNLKNRHSLLPVAWFDIVEQGTALDPKSRFASMAAWRSAVQDTLAREAAAMHGDQPTELVDTKAACPYKGLAAYQSADASRFFGREALIDELVRRVQQRRVLVVGGASGSGKSSVIRAGLIPALHAGALPGSDKWHIALFTPGRDPMAELHFQVAKTLSGNPFVSLDDLRARPTMARHLGSVNGSEQPLVLAIDQFEELFTLVPSTQRNDFITALSAMTDPADSKVHVVIAVRADFYGACAQVPWLADRITDNQVLVGPMTESELQRAITEPARRSGYHLERSLVDAIVKEAGHEAGSLPLVAHALVETWLRRRGNTLTLDGFAAAGGVAGAISQTADAIYEHHLNTVEKEATKRLFLRLVTPGEGTPDTRRILPRPEIEHDSEQDVMHRVVERLTEERLLTVDDATVQLAHEALLRSWPRLRHWIEESRDELRIRQRISHAAAEWDQSNRDKDMLYRGTLLLSALEWAGQHPDDLGGIERAFLDASAQAKTESEAIALEQERKARRVRRIAIAVLALLAAGATAASIVAFMAFRQAERQHERADAATAEARERFAIALGSAARGLVETNPLLALSLAAESVARAQSGPPGYDARATMIAARRLLASGQPFLAGSPIPAGDALTIAVSPDGSLVAVGQRDGTIDLIDVATRQRAGSSLRGHTGGVEDLDFAPNGRSLASVGDDGTLRLWTFEDGLGGKAKWVARTNDVVWGVRFSPNGSILATAGEDGSVRLWDAAQGMPMGKPLIQRIGDFLSVAFSPDGLGVVAGTGEGEIFGWRLPSGTPLFDPIRGAHTSDVWDLVFNHSGTRLATKSSDGTSTLLEFPSGRILGTAFKDGSHIDGIAFSADGNTLIGGAADGTLRLWDINRQTLSASTPRGHSENIIDVRSSRNGDILATLGKDQVIRLWNFAASYPLGQIKEVLGRSAKGVAFSADGKLLAAGDDQGGVQIWELERAEEPIQLLRHKGQVWALAFSPDRAMLASGDRAGQVLLWDVASGKLLRAITADDQAIWSLVFTPDGKSLMTASDARAALWEVETGAPRGEIRQTGGRITRAALSPDGALIATAATNGKIRLWDVASMAMMREIPVADDVIWSVAFSPDGSELATASSDEAVALWDVKTGRRRAIFAGQRGGATDVAYLRDGATIAAVDRSGEIHLWDIQTARSLTETWPGHSAASWRIALHPDGRRFATTGDDGRVVIWDLLSVARACEIGGSALDSIRRNQYLGEGEPVMACK
jgi:WD40 repeat protein/serine/threonine protein kinase